MGIRKHKSISGVCLLGVCVIWEVFALRGDQIYDAHIMYEDDIID